MSAPRPSRRAASTVRPVAGIAGMLATRWSGYLLHLPRQIRQHGHLTARQRVLSVLGSAAVLLLASAAAASAADPGGFADAFIVRDGHGLTMSQYALSLDAGGWGGATGKGISAWFATSCWDVYLIAVSVSLWLLHMALAFEWMDVLRPPLELVAGTLHQLVDQAGVVPAAMTLTALLGGLWLLRGRYGAAISEVCYAAVMGALFVGVLANPVTTITGPQGLLTRSQQLATESASQIMTAGQLDGTGPLNPNAPRPSTGVGSSTDPTVLFAASKGPNTAAARAQAKVEGRLIEIFVRIPHQMINYGSVIDGRDPRCAQVYDEVLAKGPWGEDSEPRDRMGECAKKYGEAAKQSGTAFSSTVVLMPSGGFLVLLLFVLVMCLLASGLLALYEAARLAVEAARGILPGHARAAFWQSLVGMLTAMAATVVLTVFCAIYLQLLSSVFSSGRWSAQQIFVIIDVLLLLGTIFLIVWAVRSRKKARQLGKRAASATSPEPVTIPTRRPIAAMAGGAAMLQARQRSVHRATTKAGRAHASPRPGRGGNSRSGTHSSRLSTGVRTAATIAKVGLAATVGAPVAAPSAAVAARAGLNVRRAALHARFAAARADVSAYSHEYVGNLATAGRFATNVTGARWAADKAATASAAPRVGATLAGTIAAGANPARQRGNLQTDPVNRPPAVHRPPPHVGGPDRACTPTGRLAGAGSAVARASSSARPASGTTSSGPSAVPVAPAGVPTRGTAAVPAMASPRDRLMAQLASRPGARPAPTAAPPSSTSTRHRT